MIAKNCSMMYMAEAMRKVNLKFDSNIRFKVLEMKGKNIHFTLTVWNSRQPGSRKSASAFHSDRRVAATCWHVHGHFFDELFKVAPDAIVISGGSKKITRDQGNWLDWQIGSRMYPVMYSDCCDCNN